MSDVIVTILRWTVDLNDGARAIPLKAELFGGDKEAHRFIVNAYRDTESNPVDLSGATVYGYFIRSDNVTVPIDGEIENNAAVVQLPPACYARQGRFSFTIKIARGEVLETLFHCIGNVNSTTTDEVVDPGQVVPSIDKLLGEYSKLEAVTGRAEAVVNMTAKAKTLPAGYDATADFTVEDGKGLLTIGIPLSRVEGGGGGGGMPTINETLIIDAEGDLGVNTTDQVEENNRLPITSAAVYTTVGNINALLETI